MAGYWYTDNVSSGYSHTASYTYDALGRLTGAVAKDLNSNTLWTGAYSYDQYGNFTCGPGSLNGICISFSPDSSSNRMVQISGSNQTYDAAGEVVQSVDSSGTNNYTWDAEGRLANIDGGSFTWNALGWLAEDNLEIMHGAWGRTLGWVTADGSTWYQQFVPFPGRKALGFYYGGLWAPFDHPNALGSTEMATMANGGAMADYELYPWGDVWQETGTTNFDENFGGMLRQFNQYYLTRFRRYLVPEGRWLTPDPLGGDITNPQSLNRYAYVGNDPASFTDPLGLKKPICEEMGAAACAQVMGAFGSLWNTGPFGSGDCTLDGVETPCNMVESAVTGGSAVLCPGNDCTGVLAQQGPDGTTVFSKQVWVPYHTIDSLIDGVLNISAVTGHWQTLTEGATRAPDFYQFTVNAGFLVGGSGTLTVDRYGHWYAGAGPEAGKSASTFSFSLTPGWMRGYTFDPPSPAAVQNFLTGWGCSFSGGYQWGYQFGWSSGGQADEVGLVTPQVGIGCTYAGRVP